MKPTDWHRIGREIDTFSSSAGCKVCGSMSFRTFSLNTTREISEVNVCGDCGHIKSLNGSSEPLIQRLLRLLDDAWHPPVGPQDPRRI